jgi:hypothetical protein
MAIAPPLGTSWGYGIILGLGSLFALGMVNFIPHHKYLHTNSIIGPRHMDFEAI